MAKKKVAKKKVAKKTAKKKVVKKTARKANSAFMRPVTPSAALAIIVGSKPLPRSEMVKRLWVYIKKNGLQDKVERRFINANDALKKVLGKARVSMFEMTKLVSKHVS